MKKLKINLKYAWGKSAIALQNYPDSNRHHTNNFLSTWKKLQWTPQPLQSKKNKEMNTPFNKT